MTTGEKIRQARKSANLTQKELADALGVSESFVSQYENGKREPKYQTLCKIAEALGMPSPAYFVFDPIPDDTEKSPVPNEDEAEREEFIRLYQAAPAWLQDQVRALLRAAESGDEVPGAGPKE